MYNILCYGDSNTWGSDPVRQIRLDHSLRWTSILAEKLGSDYNIIPEGLCGRTSIWRDEEEAVMSGYDYLLPCLKTHKPLDLVIILLGTNDVKIKFQAEATAIADGVGKLVDVIHQEAESLGVNGNEPQILIVAPAVIGDMTNVKFENLKSMFHAPECYQRSNALSRELEAVANDTGCHFLDAAKIIHTSQQDGIHLDPAAHKILAYALDKMIRVIRI